MSDYHKSYADQADARIKDLEKKLAEANERLETINFWHQLRETKEKLALAVEALRYLEVSTFQGSAWQMVATDALKKLKE